MQVSFSSYKFNALILKSVLFIYSSLNTFRYFFPLFEKGVGQVIHLYVLETLNSIFFSPNRKAE